MDKNQAQDVFESVGVPQVPYVALTDLAELDAKIAAVTEIQSSLNRPIWGRLSASPRSRQNLTYVLP